MTADGAYSFFDSQAKLLETHTADTNIDFAKTLILQDLFQFPAYTGWFPTFSTYSFRQSELLTSLDTGHACGTQANTHANTDTDTDTQGKPKKEKC